MIVFYGRILSRVGDSSDGVDFLTGCLHGTIVGPTDRSDDRTV